MKKNQKLFNELLTKLDDESFNKLNKQIDKILRQQKVNKDELMDKIGRIMFDYDIIDNYINLNVNDQKKVYTKLAEIITKQFNEQIKNEKEEIKNILLSASDEKYEINNYVYHLGVDFTLTHVDESTLNHIVNTEINGELWSSRNYNNKNAIVAVLKRDIKDFIGGRISVNEIKQILTRRYNVNATNSTRLIRTEICRCQAAANEIWCSNHHIQQQMFTATLDNRTSTQCREYDGQIFSFNDTNKPIPPLHPQCRSCLISVVDNWIPDERLNNQMKQRINYQTFQEWISTL